MIAPRIISGFTPSQQAAAVVLGLATFATMGITACVALILALLWLIVQFALLTLQAVFEALNAIGATFMAADPLARFLALVLLVCVLCHIHYSRQAARKEAH